ncbi:MAG: lipid biosynthesis lauroyl acyltransferase [Deltaproteobacteria bacterium]|nr:lipid biosynthesis lauroyl acyltransferase [Deltaproteobacteria bacterium]
MFPLFIKRFAAVSMSRVAYYLLQKHKLIAVHNLTRSFPEKSLTENLQIVKDTYANFALTFIEFLQILYLNRDNLHHWVSVKGLEHYERACNEGKGVLLFTAHFGNWEMGNAALAILSKPPIFMARVLDSPFLEEITTFVRSRLGVGNIHKKNVLSSILSQLRKGEVLKLLIDQNAAAREGVFVNFFGRPACATTGIALMAMHTGAAVLPVFTTRMPDGRYLTEIGPKVETVNTGNRDQDVLQNTQNYNTIIENHVRQYPGQWLWLHQRWKTKPVQARRMKS